MRFSEGLVPDPAVELMALLVNSGDHGHSLPHELDVVASHNADSTGELGMWRQVAGAQAGDCIQHGQRHAPVPIPFRAPDDDEAALAYLIVAWFAYGQIDPFCRRRSGE